MTERWKPSDGRSLTPRERELLEILQEECAEVIQAASKLLRFGVGNTNPTTGERNDRALGLEVGDLNNMIRRVILAEIVNPLDVGDGDRRKDERLERYLQTESPEEARASRVDDSLAKQLRASIERNSALQIEIAELRKRVADHV